MKSNNNVRRATTIGLASLASLVLTTSCNENLPIGPDSFAASVQMIVPRDTLIVGDSSVATVKATDASGRQVLALKFGWSSADSSIISFATAADSEAASGRTRVLVGKKPGRAAVSVALPDIRFITSNTTRTQTVVVGGVKVLTSHDTTLTAINDTASIISTSLVKSNGALVNKASLGIKWTHLGTHTTVVGTGDTIRYIAKSNGLDTLIASHDFCLAGAKCADTVFARVGQLLTLSLSTRNFTAWSFGDSVGPTIILADRRGTGLAGTSVRFVPVTAADSAIVRLTTPIGTSNPVNGALAAPQMISQGNGTAKVRVLALLPDGFSVVAIDSVTEKVRQVARRVSAEPLRGSYTANDSLPILPAARDARGALIKDATVTFSTTNLFISGNYAAPVSGITAPTVGTIVPSITGIALPDSNPAAPQVPVLVNVSTITMLKPDTVVAGATQRLLTVTSFDSLGNPAAGKWVRFGASGGIAPDSVLLDGSGNANVTWTPPDSGTTFTLTGVRGNTTPMTTFADSAGRVVLVYSVTIKAEAVPNAAKSTVAVSQTSVVHSTNVMVITVTVKDRFGNPIKTAVPGDFTATTGGVGGTIGAFSCTDGVCSASYTAPVTPGSATIIVKIGGADVQLSPFTITIT